MSCFSNRDGREAVISVILVLTFPILPSVRLPRSYQNATQWIHGRFVYPRWEYDSIQIELRVAPPPVLPVFPLMPFYGSSSFSLPTRTLLRDAKRPIESRTSPLISPSMVVKLLF